MRPPSYYASIVKSNGGYHSSPHNYGGSSSSDSYATPRTSSQQLRSSLSSPSSSSYVSRSHLPFVPQSTLVAHCFTGVGSSTRPYGGSHSTSPSSSSSSSSTTSYLGSRASSSSLSSYSSPSYSSSSYSPISRPASTKRPTTSHYSSSSGSSGYSSSRYLSPSVSATATTSGSSSTSHSSRYRPTTSASSYYQPIRLRERPLLTQISRQINSSSSSSAQQPARLAAKNEESKLIATTTTPSHSSASEPEESGRARKVSESENNSETTTMRTKLSVPSESADPAQQLPPPPPDDDSNWSSDVTRNISRNKYLIKFREFDKHSRPSVDVEATIQLAPTSLEAISSEINSHPCEEELTLVPSATILLPAAVAAAADATVDEPSVLPAKKSDIKLSCDIKSSEELESAKSEADPAAEKPPKSTTTAARERKNVKLKLKPIGAAGSKKKKKSETLDLEATTTTTISGVPTADAHKARPAKTEATGAAQPASDAPVRMKAERRPSSDLVDPKVAKKQAEPKQPEPKAEPKAKQEPDKVAVSTKSPVGENKIRSEPPSGQKNANKENKKALGEAKGLLPPVGAPANIKTDHKTVAETKKNKENEMIEETTTAIKTDVAAAAAADDQKQGEKAKSKIVKKKVKKAKENAEPSEHGKSSSARKASKEAQTTPSVPEQQARKVTSAPATPPVSGGGGGGTRQPPSRIRFREYNINDFNFLTVLGHGGWGFVILAELKEHDACFAVKCIKKITIVEDDDYDSIMIERKVLALGNIHPFICKLFCTFETPGYLFFVMEYCAGGDLMFHVQHEGKFSESRCRFYAAEIICAIRFLHNRHIIYRDLKLDNILLDAQGHIRLVDFGMCQCRTYREEMLPSNFCGTPEYISPEIIKGVPYNHSVDWWSFGVLLYEMAVGKMPFRGNDENELLWNVCYEQIHYPMFLTKELTTLLKSLLEREPTKRMGMATCKAGDIYDQPFFRGVDWKAVEQLRVEPPFVPEVRSNRDVSNFDSDFTESTCELSPVDEGTLARIDQKQFEKFPYTNPDIFMFDPLSQNQKSQQQQQQSR